MIKGIFSVFIFISGFVSLYAADENTLIASTETRSQSEITASTESVGFPKLLWEKKLAKAITSSAISNDGTKIAIADETGYLTLYNVKGEKLWDYHYEGNLPKRAYDFKSDKADTAILNVKFSASGTFIVCDLGVLNTWKELQGFANIARYEPHKKLCFDADGKLLWQTPKQGEHIIGGDEYILIVQFVPDERDYESTLYSLLDVSGKSLSVGKTSGQCVACNGFSDNARYMFVDNKLIESKGGHVVWELAREGLVEFREVGQKYAVIVHKGGMNIKGEVYDISTRRKLLDVVGGPFLSITDNYVANMGWTNLRIYKIATKRVAWERGYKQEELLGNKLLLYLAKDEKHLMVGGETGLMLYSLAGKELWKLPLKIKRYANLDCYAVAENAELFLFSEGAIVRMYKSF